MRTLRLCLTGAVTFMLLGGLGAVAAVAQDEPSPEPSATPRPVGEVCERVELPYDPEDIRLSGVWFDNLNNVAYVSQVGSRIYLLHQTGRAEPPDQLGRFWTTVATGTLAEDGTMTLDYGVVPRGEWLFEDFGTMTGRVTGQPGEATSFSLHYPQTPYRSELLYTLTPCAPTTHSTEGFEPAFTFRDEARVGLSLADLAPGLASLVASDPSNSGVAVFSIVPESAKGCDGPAATIEPGAAAFLEWLRSRSDLVVGEDVAVSVDGRPATMVDITAAPGAATCVLDGQVRVWQSYGIDGGVLPGGVLRNILLDVDDATVAISFWGWGHEEEWFPLAQKIVDTIHFTD